MSIYSIQCDQLNNKHTKGSKQQQPKDKGSGRPNNQGQPERPTTNPRTTTKDTPQMPPTGSTMPPPENYNR